MLTRIDRVVLAVPDADAAAARWMALLDAEPAGDDRVRPLAARRTRLRLGTGWVELFEPDGAGAIADAVAARGPHLYAAGAATPSFHDLLAHIEGKGVTPVRFGSQALVDAGEGLRVLLSPDEPQPALGLIDHFYESTLLVPDAVATTRRVTALFDLDPAPFVEIASPKYGYHGTLTLFRPGDLHRFEIITPTDTTKTMGRFFAKAGPVLYMCFAETDRLVEIEARAKARGDGHTPVRPAGRDPAKTADEVFLHPASLGGMMLGLSRRTMAWTWSGAPERVSPVA
jgi:hypothetical protein